MNSNDYQLKMRQAWSTFVEEGIINEDVVRPEINRSWLRSLGVDPYKPSLHQLPDRIILSKKADNIRLISIARPIMEQLCVPQDSTFVLLSDQEGYILEGTGRNRTASIAGQLNAEEVIGTNAIGTALAEQTFLEINGAEHYCSYYHNIFSAACPLHDWKGRIIGVLAIYSTGHELPVGSLVSLQLAKRVIEDKLHYKAEQSKILHVYHNTCSAIIDIYDDPIIVIDHKFTIANINDSCLTLLGYENREGVVGLLIDQLIADEPQVLNNLLSNDPNQFSSRFTLQTNKGRVPCALERRRVVPNPDGTQQIILVFQPIESVALTTYGEAMAQGKVLTGTPFECIVGDSQAINAVKNMAYRASKVLSNVLIGGESGTGKEIIAHSIHEASGRRGQFIPINCGAIPKELMQSELFGYVEGAFTGAKKSGRVGKFELANQGTIFLDEIGEMPLDMQVTLLRFLQDKTVTRVGGSESSTVDVRIIAATNRNLKNEIGAGRFREDLYYRLNVISLVIPPLRARKSDIPIIARYLMKNLCCQMKREAMEISDQAMGILLDYNWPGNVRELKNVLENAIVFSEGAIITENVLPSYLKDINRSENIRTQENDRAEVSIRESRQQQKIAAGERERDEILRLLDQYKGNITEVARHMGFSRNTIYKKMQSYMIKR